MVVEFGDHDPAFVDHGIDQPLPFGAEHRRPVHDEDARRVVIEVRSLARVGRVGGGCEMGDHGGIGGHRRQRMNDPQMRHAADRPQHVAGDHQTPHRRPPRAPDILQRERGPRVGGRIDPQIAQRGQHRLDEGLAGRLIEDARLDVDRHEAGADQAARHRVVAEPSQMAVVEQAGVLITERSPQQPLGQPPMLYVRDADQHHAVRRQRLGVAGEDGERVGELFQDGAVDDAVDAVRGVERQCLGPRVGEHAFVVVRAGRLDHGWIVVDRQQPRVGVETAVGRAHEAGPAADIQNNTGAEGNEPRQVGHGRHQRRCLPHGPATAGAAGSGGEPAKAAGGRRKRRNVARARGHWPRRRLGNRERRRTAGPVWPKAAGGLCALCRASQLTHG